MKWTSGILLLFTALGLSACSTMGGPSIPGEGVGRLDGDGPSDYGGRAPASTTTPGNPEDEGNPNFGRTLSQGERDQMETRLELRQLEDQLTSPAEVRQYERVKPYLNSTPSRIQFLRQGTYDAKERWALAQGIYAVEAAPSTLARAGESLHVGLMRPQVRELLGEPDLVESAGNPRYGNERWKYDSAEPSNRGYHNQIYYIYFEGGRVVGWQSNY